MGQYIDLNQLLVVKLRCQLSESVYQYVHEHNKENRMELYSINLQYFNFYVGTVSISQCAITHMVGSNIVPEIDVHVRN